ncbi:hypothetical protein LZ30DRAFT_719229 [Colletotrichum cereale]|nr:hypothetical protein LZ30DRAFT_719229 [Colletotrichum cereale]
MMIFHDLVALFSLLALGIEALAVGSRSEENGALATQNVTVDKCSPSSPDGIQPGCWEAMRMNEYLDAWWYNNSARCDSTNRGFAQCYLDTAGLITWNCNFVALNRCTPPPSGREYEYANYQEFYVIWNIYTLNLFFTNYHQALIGGQATAIGAVAEIVKVVAPPTKANAKTPFFGPIFGTVWNTLGAIGPIIGTYIGVPQVVAFIAVTGIIANAPGVVNILYPAHDVYQVSWEQLSSTLSDNVNDYQQRVGEALTKIQTDFTTFRQMTSTGWFAQAFQTDLPRNTDFMYHNLLKYVFNQALQQNDYFIVKNPGVDPTKIEINHFNCVKLDKFGTCGPIWYDGKDSYGLARANDIGMDRMKEILDIAFEKNWTTPAELYLDPQNCQGKSAADKQFDPQSLNISCVSNLPVCEFNFDYNPFEEIDYHTNPPQFKNCPNQEGYGVPPYWSTDVAIPLTYLGPFLMTDHIYNEKSG